MQDQKHAQESNISYFCAPKTVAAGVICIYATLSRGADRAAIAQLNTALLFHSGEMIPRDLVPYYGFIREEQRDIELSNSLWGFHSMEIAGTEMLESTPKMARCSPKFPLWRINSGYFSHYFHPIG